MSGQFIQSIFWKGLNFDGAEKHVLDFFLDPKTCSGMFFSEMSRKANQVWAHDVESTWSISRCLLFEAWITLVVLAPILSANMSNCFSRLQPKLAGNASI